MYFVREENIQDGGNELFTVDQIKVFSDSDEEMGYIKLTYISSNTNFNLFTFLGLKGHCGIPTSEEKFNSITDPKKKHLITYTMAQVGRIGWGRSNELASVSECAADYKKFLEESGIIKSLHERFDAEHQMYINHFVDKPFVDFIRVHDDFQGNGLGYHLYQEAATWMAEKNMQVRLSSLVCHNAVHSIRKKMEDQNMIERGTVTWYTGEEECFILKAPEGISA